MDSLGEPERFAAAASAGTMGLAVFTQADAPGARIIAGAANFFATGGYWRTSTGKRTK
jgi:hypothetical protein